MIYLLIFWSLFSAYRFLVLKNDLQVSLLTGYHYIFLFVTSFLFIYGKSALYNWSHCMNNIIAWQVVYGHNLFLTCRLFIPLCIHNFGTLVYKLNTSIGMNTVINAIVTRLIASSHTTVCSIYDCSFNCIYAILAMHTINLNSVCVKNWIVQFLFLDFDEVPPQHAPSPLKCLIVSFTPKQISISRIITIITFDISTTTFIHKTQPIERYMYQFTLF